MNKTERGYEPVSGFLEFLMKKNPAFQSLPPYRIQEYSPLLDSSNMQPENWLNISRDIAANYSSCDGFVVVHGTDTMAYTSSALSFLLENLGKPVIITGSQVPLVEPYSDATTNLIGALTIAGTRTIPEVMVFFGNHLLRGNRIQKFSAWDFRAFAGGDFPPLGQWSGSFHLETDLVLPMPTLPFRAFTTIASAGEVVMVPLFPGISGKFMREALAVPVRGAVLLAFGTGNGPDQDVEFLAALRNATSRGVVVVDTTQCHQGTVDLGEYATGNALKEAGCTGGFDITPEAAFTKLIWLLGDSSLSPSQVRALVPANLRGELSLESRLPPAVASSSPSWTSLSIISVSVSCSLALVIIGVAGIAIFSYYRYKTRLQRQIFLPIAD